MIDLTNFTKKSLINESLYLTITESGVSCNKYCLDKLDRPEKVSLYLDEERQRLLIIKDSAGDVNFVSPKRNHALYVRWNKAEFRDELIEWAKHNNNDITLETGAKIPGDYYPDDKAIMFEFKRAKPNKAIEYDLPF